MPPSAQLMTGKAWAPRLTLDRSGNRGVANYLVSSVVAETALTATGLPAIGDAYGTALPGAYARTVEPIPLGGGRSTPANPNLNGWSRVQVTYGPPDQAGVTPDLSTFTEVNQSTRSVGVMYPVDPDTGLPEPGSLRFLQPATAMTGWTQCDVHRFYGLTIPSAIKSYILGTLTNPCRTNDAGIVLPRYGSAGSFDTLTLGPGQALYLSHSVTEAAPGVLRLTHHLVISKDFFYREAEETEDGSMAEASPIPRVIQPEASFAGLW